jgi:hypothetical protein
VISDLNNETDDKGCHVISTVTGLQVLHIADFLHNKPHHPLCIKALQRRSAARKVPHSTA